MKAAILFIMIACMAACAACADERAPGWSKQVLTDSTSVTRLSHDGAPITVVFNDHDPEKDGWGSPWVASGMVMGSIPIVNLSRPFMEILESNDLPAGAAFVYYHEAAHHMMGHYTDRPVAELPSLYDRDARELMPALCLAQFEADCWALGKIMTGDWDEPLRQVERLFAGLPKDQCRDHGLREFTGWMLESMAQSCTQKFKRKK